MKKGVLLILLLITAVTQASAFEFCDDGTVGEDLLRIISVDDMLKDNSEEWKWETLQNIELEIRLENRDDKNKDYILEVVFTENGDEVDIAEDDDDLEKEIRLSSNERESVSLEFQIDEDIEIGDYEIYVKFYKKGDENEECVENAEEQITIEKIELCEDGNVDEDDLEITKITNIENNDDERWNWVPGDTIEISVDVSNKEYVERDFVIELIMLDKNNEEVELSQDQSRIETTETIDQDDEEIIEFYFKLDQNIEEGDYTLYAKMYDEDDDEICTALKAEKKSSPKQIKIRREQNNIIITEIIGPTEVTRNSEAVYIAKILNAGSENEKKVAIIAYNKILGLKQTIELDDLESGQTTEITFNLQLPENATLGKHGILFTAEFKYDSKRNAYREFSKDDNDIKYFVEIEEEVIVEEEVEEEIIENETVEEEVENETIFEDFTLEDEELGTSSPITGNVVGTSDETSIWPTTIGLFALAIIGVFLFIKKPKLRRRKKNHEEEPIVTRRYSASLGQQNP